MLSGVEALLTSIYQAFDSAQADKKQTFYYLFRLIITGTRIDLKLYNHKSLIL